MRVAICGPNLRDQSNGEFHVHDENCSDLRNYGPGKRLGGEEPWMLDVSDRLGIVGEVYDWIPHEEASDYLSEFHFAPCCAELETQ
jgi:hypothetical protein